VKVIFSKLWASEESWRRLQSAASLPSKVASPSSFS
jgi:hypothetical protein